MRKNYEDQLRQLEETKNGVIEEQKNSYEAQLKEKENFIKEVLIKFV